MIDPFPNAPGKCGLIADRRWGVRCAVAAGLAVLAVAATAQFLMLGALPATPANDLAMHTAMVGGFFEALASGQWLPRLLNAPGHVPDIPVFQYYGFVTGLIGQPGLACGLSAFPALMVGVAGFRLFGLAVVYVTGRLLGGDRPVAFLAAAVYGLTPYLLSNLYGRVDVAETLAHCELPLLALGMVLAMTGRVAGGTAVLAGAVFCLALTHPIFLLYGAVAMGLLALAAGSRRVWAAAVAGGAIGLLLSAFQWYPAVLSDDLLSGHFLKYSPFHAATLTSASGLYGLPLTMADRGWSSSEAPFVFHTPGWLTLPMLAALALAAARHRGTMAVRLILVPLAVFLFLAYSPIDVFQFLPRQTWALQMPYRLLAFVALFTALALPLVWPRLPVGWAAVLLAVTVAQSAPVLSRSTYVTPLDVPAATYASTDYLIREHSTLTGPDGWLAYYARQIYPQPPSRDDRVGAVLTDDFADAGGWLRWDNRWTVRRAGDRPSRLVMTGELAASGASVRLWLASADRPEWPLSEVRPIAFGRFSLSLSLPAGQGPFRLVTDPPGARVRLTAIDGIPDGVLRRGAVPGPAVLHLRGETLPWDGPTDLWLATPEAPSQPLTGRFAVGPGAFDLVMPLPDAAGDYVLVPSRFRVPSDIDPASTDHRRLSVHLSLVEIDGVSANGVPVVPLVIPESAVGRVVIGGYDRRFLIKPDSWPEPGGHLAKAVPVVLPLAFNPFFALTQNGQTLAAYPDPTGRAVITTADMATPIEARYRLPMLCWVAMVAGLLALGGLGLERIAKRRTRLAA